MSNNTKKNTNEIEILKEKINNLENKKNILLENKESDNCMRNNMTTNIIGSSYNKLKNKILKLKNKINSLINNKPSEENDNKDKDDENIVKV